MILGIDAEKLARLGGMTALGVTAAALTGVHPLIGAGMAAVAGLVSLVAEPAFKVLGDSVEGPGDSLRGRAAFWSLTTAFAWSLTQLTQLFFSAIGYAVPLGPSALIVAPAWLVGPTLGDALLAHLRD